MTPRHHGACVGWVPWRRGSDRSVGREGAYAEAMTIEPTAASLRLRGLLVERRDRVVEVLARYDATNPRIFGSAARGDAGDDSDVDLLVDLVPGAGNELLRVAGIAEELSEVLGVRVDVVSAGLLRDEVSATAVLDAVAV